MKFFFDTADVGYIIKAWDKLKEDVSPQSVVGITTNPNALNKINCNNLAEWKRAVQRLCELVTKIRNDDKGVVYVQQPASSMSSEEVITWVKLARDWTDGVTSIGLKIPPFKKNLEIVDELSHYADVNVTGVADCSTALRAFSYGVRYVSIITGRMEEQGIDAKAQIAFTQGRRVAPSEIIAGSMRTVEGLKWVCEYGTVPTIGTRVWDVLFEGLGVHEFKTFWDKPRVFEDSLFSPTIDDRMTNLSRAFFEQMDNLGKTVCEEFLAVHKN